MVWSFASLTGEWVGYQWIANIPFSTYFKEYELLGMPVEQFFTSLPLSIGKNGDWPLQHQKR
jgi:hypothetical protein